MSICYHLKCLVRVYLNCMGKADDFNTTMGTIIDVSFMAQAFEWRLCWCEQQPQFRVSCSVQGLLAMKKTLDWCAG